MRVGPQLVLVTLTLNRSLGRLQTTPMTLSGQAHARKLQEPGGKDRPVMKMGLVVRAMQGLTICPEAEGCSVRGKCWQRLAEDWLQRKESLVLAGPVLFGSPCESS